MIKKKQDCVRTSTKTEKKQMRRESSYDGETNLAILLLVKDEGRKDLPARVS